MKKMSFRNITAPILLTVFLSPTVLLLSCHTDSKNKETQFVTDTSRIVQYAQGYQLSDEDGYRLLSIFSPFQKGGDTVRYALVDKNQQAPAGFSRAQVIRTPIASLAVTSNLHVGAVDQLREWDKLVAVGDGAQVFSEMVRQRIAAGKVSEIQKGGQIDLESVIALHPDVLMVTGSPEAGLEAYAGITQSGVTVIINSEWMENTPLGRAEWIKLIGALCGDLNAAQHQFAFVQSNYHRLAEKVRIKKDILPKVLIGNEFQGTWHMPGGKSFMARILQDAGADYEWKDNGQTGGIPLAFESVYPLALEAETWLNIFLPSVNSGKSALLATDARYSAFKSVKENRLYSFNGRIADNGANDYWESSAYRPDLLLGDYVHILHPDLLPEHLLYYCNQLKP